MTMNSHRQAILAALADLGGVVNAAQLRRQLGDRPDPQLLNQLQVQLPQRLARVIQPRPGEYHLTAAGLRELARGANLAAALLPADADTVAPVEPGHEVFGSYPSLTVAGAQAFLYVDGAGVLVLSLQLDTGEVPDWLTLADGCIPLRVTVYGDEVFADARPVLSPAEPS